MGQKTHPYGFRLGYNKRGSRGGMRQGLRRSSSRRRQAPQGAEGKAEERGNQLDRHRARGEQVVVRIYTARPGIIIGRKGAEIDKLKQEVQKRTKREVHIDIQEVHRPELDAQLVASRSHCSSKSACLPPRDAQGGGFGAALRLQGIKVRVQAV